MGISHLRKEYALQYKFKGEHTWLTECSFPRLGQALSIYFSEIERAEPGIAWRVKKP